ncbi:MAG: hypothetical protein ACREQI_05480 [Candidatus Binataceae bacterium]
MRGSIAGIGILAAVVVATTAIAPPRAAAQLPRMGIPLATTIVVAKPAPGQIYGNRQTVTMGVKGKTYRFVLKDAWVNDPMGKVHWSDVWQQVNFYQPNFMVVGLDESVFKKIDPGQTLTVRGLYTSLGRNFEVTGTQLGGGPYAPAKHY